MNRVLSSWVGTLGSVQRALLGTIVLGSALALPMNAAGQTFSQVLQMGQGVGSRLTRTVTLDSLNSSVFALMYDHVTWIDARGSSPIVYEFATDPIWPKVVFSRKDEWIRGFNDWSAAQPLAGPRGLDVSATRKVFVTDPPTGRVVKVSLDDVQKRLITGGGIGGFAFPVDVAWHGGPVPLTQEDVYVLDWGGISYWGWSGVWSNFWTYGSRGSGTGQFLGASGICAGHTATSINASSLFTTNFYVADAGNRRIVWLQLGPNNTAPTWKGERSLPEGWRPVDCTTDHFGNVYVADEQNSQIVKYTWNLEEITRYGSYGTGETNYNTFAHPHAVHVPFGIKTVGGQDIWYGEGRILTAEDWGPGSGGLEHWLGVEIPQWYAQPSAWGPTAWFYLTDHSHVVVEVLNEFGTYVATALNSLTLPTWHSVLWTGYTDGGQEAPPGDYKFRITATSAYGCQGQAWCQTTKTTNLVYWDGPPAGCTCDEPGEYCVPCMANVALVPNGLELSPGLPRRYRLGQAITPYSGPLLRTEGTGAASAASSAMTDAQAVASVRTHGITALHLDVPQRDAKARVTIRIYSLTGRLVRVLVDETLDAGSYVVGWDGTDAQGREVLPGVYLAHMTAGDYRGMQRLILR